MRAAPLRFLVLLLLVSAFVCPAPVWYAHTCAKTPTRSHLCSNTHTAHAHPLVHHQRQPDLASSERADPVRAVPRSPCNGPVRICPRSQVVGRRFRLERARGRRGAARARMEGRMKGGTNETRQAGGACDVHAADAQVHGVAGVRAWERADRASMPGLSRAGRQVRLPSPATSLNAALGLSPSQACSRRVAS